MAEVDGHYRFLLGDIPIRKGLIGFSISNAGSVYRKNEQQQCFGATFNMHIGNDNPLELYQAARPDYIPNDLERYNVYYIDVK